MTPEELTDYLTRAEEVIIRHYLHDCTRTPLSLFDWSPLLIVVAVFWAALG